MTITNEQIENWFTYHPPTPEQQAKYQAIRAETRELAQSVAQGANTPSDIEKLVTCIREHCPAGVDRDTALFCLASVQYLAQDGLLEAAISDLRAAVMWANAAIACGGSK